MHRGDAHVPVTEFGAARYPPACRQIPLHVWPDSTLREIAAMVMTAPETLSAADAGGGVGRRAWMARGGAALRFVMRTVYPNRAGVFVAKMLGTVSTRDMSPDDERTLAQLSFQTGDYLDILVRSA